MAARACAVLLALGALAGCRPADADPRAMTCRRLAHDARARTLFVDAIDNRLHARSMAPLRGLPTDRQIAAFVAARCAVEPASAKPYREALDALS